MNERKNERTNELKKWSSKNRNGSRSDSFLWTTPPTNEKLSLAICNPQKDLWRVKHFFVSSESGCLAVRPDWSTFRYFGKNSEGIWPLLEGLFSFGQNVAPTLAIFMVWVAFFVVACAQERTRCNLAIWSHCFLGTSLQVSRRVSFLPPCTYIHSLN